MKKILTVLALAGASVIYLFSRTATPAGAALQVANSSPSSNPPPAAPPIVTSPPGTIPPPTSSSVPSGTSAAPAPAPAPVPAPQTGMYKDGTYTGPSVDAYYGIVQVQATVSGGKISNVTFLSYPNSHSTSRFINSQAMPMLTQEALSIQSANVNLISGATATSLGFQQSLGGALASAKN